MFVLSANGQDLGFPPAEQASPEGLLAVGGDLQPERLLEAYRHGIFPWYNDEHRHSGLGLHTPASVHYGQAAAIREQRAVVLADAYAAHPERFVRVMPQPPLLPDLAAQRNNQGGGRGARGAGAPSQ